MTDEAEKRLVEALEIHNEIMLVVAKQLSLICHGGKLCKDVSGRIIDDLEKRLIEKEKSSDEVSD